jgi:hypothetical protein
MWSAFFQAKMLKGNCVVQSDLGIFCYFLLGAGLLAPWNALITAADYFQAVYPVGVVRLLPRLGPSSTALVTQIYPNAGLAHGQAVHHLLPPHMPGHDRFDTAPSRSYHQKRPHPLVVCILHSPHAAGTYGKKYIAAFLS